MPLSAYQQPVRSNPAVHFLEALDTNEGSANVELRLPTRDPLWFVRAITLVAVQNLDYELQLFSSAVNMGATIALDKFNAVWQFGALSNVAPASPGYPFTPADKVANGFFHYYVDGNSMPIWDLDQLVAPNPNAQQPLGTGSANADPNNAHLHVRLINRSVASKSAGALGAVQVSFYVSAQGQQV